MYQTRIEKLSRLLEKDQIDLIAINAGQSLAYLSGLHFHLSERPTVLLIGKGGKPAIIFPEFEREKVKDAQIELTPFAYPENPALWAEIFEKALNYFIGKKAIIGLEPTAARFLEIKLFQEASDAVTFRSAALMLEHLRMIKDEDEVECIREAVKIAQMALERTIPIIKVGITEHAIANELVINLLRCGSDPELPFTPIIASGPNSANPHAFPGNRELKDGDFIVIDWGARTKGYISDITRTFVLGSADEEMTKIYETVKLANETARSMPVKNLLSENLDAAAREIINSAGYGDYFTHRTGHGIGLEAHEEPYIAPQNKTEITHGMIFTIEPGIYIPSKGGVRIEDNVFASKSDLMTLTSFDRTLKIL
ncbi:MAG: aminopeptidase P family protein [Pelolinea sp.]|nr:aminopeptidase P family protein [Pelolinea sp.]